MKIREGQFVQVPNRPPYQHHRACPDYFATRGDVIFPARGCGGRAGGRGVRVRLDLLFTPTEIRRAAHRAQKNREDLPPARRRWLAGLLRRL